MPRPLARMLFMLVAIVAGCVIGNSIADRLMGNQASAKPIAAMSPTNCVASISSCNISIAGNVLSYDWTGVCSSGDSGCTWYADCYVYNASNTRVAVFSSTTPAWDCGETHTFHGTWTLPALPHGNYTAVYGAFNGPVPGGGLQNPATAPCTKSLSFAL